MRKSLFISLIALIGLLSVSRHVNAQVIILEKKENSATVKPSAIFTVQIPMQAATGYDWKLGKGSPLIYEVKATVEENISGSVGNKTMKVFTLRSSGSTGEADLRFVLSRPTENGAPADEKSLKVNIKP